MVSSGAKVFVISRCAWTLFNFRRSLIEAISARGARVVALGAGGDGYEEKLTGAGIEFRHIPVSRRGLNPLADLWLFVRLASMMVRERPDVVHCFTIKPAIYGTLAAHVCGARAIVVTITGLGHAFTSASGWLTRFVGALYRFALARADVVYFQNDDDRRLFIARSLVARDKTRLCAGGSGVDLARFSPAPLPVESGRSRPRFLMIARLIREKGVLEYLEASRIVRERYPDAECWLLGGEDPRNPSALRPEEIDALKGSNDVRWLGAADDVRPFIAQSDVIVLPSYREGLPRSLLEGGAMGRPAIAADVVGCRDVVVDGATGILVRARDAAALADAMTHLIEHPARVVEMGRAARERVVEHYDERSVLRETISQYNLLTDPERMDGEPTAPA